MQTLHGTLQAWRDLAALMGGSKQFLLAVTTESWWTESQYNRLRSALRRVGIIRDPGKSLANLYLSFKFGWQSMFQALQGFLRSPELIAKDLNRLIARNGRFTTLSRSISWTEEMAAPPTISMPTAILRTCSPDASHPLGFKGLREVELRCCVNSGIYFPKIDVPDFRWNMFLRKYGVSTEFPWISPGDLYDLIPWTWLLDWFVGLGNYIHLMDVSNGDRSIVNYGFMTYKSIGRVTGRQTYSSTATYSEKSIPPDTASSGGFSSSTKVLMPMDGQLELKYELRLSLATLASSSVKTYAGQNLTSDQKTIIGALVNKFL
jgi:hypothetical protein